jgi:predicted nucleotidyltransferase
MVCSGDSRTIKTGHGEILAAGKERMRKSETIKKIEETMAKLEETFVKDEKILGAFYCGTSGTSSYGEYSDIDLVLVVADEDQKDFFKKVPKVLGETVGLKSAVNAAGEDVEWCCLVTDDYIGLDLPIFKKANLVSSPKFANIRILKDHHGLLRFKKRSAALKSRIDTKSFVNDIRQIKDDQLCLARQVRKGQLLEAISECTRDGEELFHWLVKLKGVQYQPPSLRDAEKILTEKELEMLLETRVKNPVDSEIRACMKGLWKLMLHVIDEYEKRTGRKFPTSHDDNHFLELVNDVYEGRRF